MKKLFLSAAVVSMFTMVACGPSAEEKAAAEKAKQDSIAAVQAEQARLDSIAAAEAEKMKQDSIAAAEAEKARLDSIATAEAAKAATKGSKKPAPKKEEPKTAPGKSYDGATKPANSGNPNTPPGKNYNK